MVPNAADITRGRMVAFAAVRFVGVLITLYVVGAIAQYIVYYAQMGTFGGYMSSHVGAVWLVAVLLAGLLMVFAPGLWSRVLVPFRRDTGCPGCRYPLHDLNDPKCPECGLELTGEFLAAGQNSSGGPASELATRVRLRAVMVPVTRLVGVLLVLAYGLDAVTNVLEVFFSTDADRSGLAQMLYRFFGTTLGVVMVVRANAFAHWLVFGRRPEPEET